MKKIFISEKDMPISCYGCVCYDGENGRCKVLDTYLEGEHIPRICPLKSLEQHDNEVRREFAEKVKASVCENAYTVYYDKFSSDNGMTEDGFNELIDNLLKQYEVGFK